VQANCLKVYNAYISTYDQAVTILSEAMLSTRFKTFVEEKQKAYGSQSIASLLITPIQRIPRYTLLLKQLHENLPSSHEDSVAVRPHPSPLAAHHVAPLFLLRLFAFFAS
jgi:hypothetical protein